MVSAIALAALLVVILAGSVPPARAAGGITGTWECCGEGGAAAQNFVITDNGGSLSGQGLQPGGASFAVISGTQSGSSVTIVTTYEASFAPGYVATFVGTVSGETMSGSWTSNAGQSGTWTARLAAGTGTSKKTTAPGSSFTAVECTISVVAPDTSTCTAQVAGFDAKHPVSPTGSVAFTATSGTVGSSCSLTATPGSPGISSCTVSYLPSPALMPGQPAPVTAHYAGDSNFKASTGVSSYAPVGVVLDEDESFTDATEVADGGSSEGIPVDLTNTNPFPVSADEQLTVSGYPSVANTSAAHSARTQVIGRALYKLAPLQTILTRVKLSRGGAKLLRRHRHLSATLVVTTQKAGQPARTTRRRLTLKS
jgi:hypothetical protein